MVKGFLAKLETDCSFISMERATREGTYTEHDEFFWLRALRWCPRGLLDLINSKACRGEQSVNLWVACKPVEWIRCDNVQ